MSGPLVIAIDGPAAAGKGTLARMIANEYGLAYLDTGALYRAVAAKVLAAGGDPANATVATAAARSLDERDRARPNLRDEAVGNAAAIVAAIPDVRNALLDYQRQFAAHPPGGAVGVVLDGRDIGTRVCPEAGVKLFVTASVAERARRRVAELEAKGQPVDQAAILADLRKRDEQDRTRAASPLVPAQDAHLLDTTELAIDPAFAIAKTIIAAHLGDWSAA